jgi:hypothetical protein
MSTDHGKSAIRLLTLLMPPISISRSRFVSSEIHESFRYIACQTLRQASLEIDDLVEHAEYERSVGLAG